MVRRSSADAASDADRGSRVYTPPMRLDQAVLVAFALAGCARPAQRAVGAPPREATHDVTPDETAATLAKAIAVATRDANRIEIRSPSGSLTVARSDAHVPHTIIGLAIDGERVRMRVQTDRPCAGARSDIDVPTREATSQLASAANAVCGSAPCIDRVDAMVDPTMPAMEVLAIVRALSSAATRPPFALDLRPSTGTVDDDGMPPAEWVSACGQSVAAPESTDVAAAFARAVTASRACYRSPEAIEWLGLAYVIDPSGRIHAHPIEPSPSMWSAFTACPGSGLTIRHVTDAATVECVTKAFNEESVPPFGGWSGRGVRTTHSVVVARTGACISGREAPRATAR